jgi:hypothetical protein
MRVGKSPEGSTERGRRAWLRDLKGLGRDTAMIMPPGYDLTLLEAQGRTWEIHSEAIEWADRAIAVTLAGQTVTTEGTSGFSTGNIHRMIARELTAFTAGALGQTLHAQVLRPWAGWNFAGGAGGAPTPTWDTEPPESQAEKADAIGKLGLALTQMDAALAPTGKRVDSLAVAERFGLPLVDSQAAAPPTAGTPPPALGGQAPQPPLAADVIDEPLTDEDAAALAVEMTTHGIARCEHGAVNRCRLCRVERVRGVVLRDDGTPDQTEEGSPKWKVAWRPMGAPRAKVAA